RDCRHVKLRQSRRRKNAPCLPMDATSSSGSRRIRRSWTGGVAWRAASHLKMACDELLSVSGGLSSGAPENVCAQALIEAWCRVAPSDRRLLSARGSDGRPGPVLEATLPSSPVSPGRWSVSHPPERACCSSDVALLQGRRSLTPGSRRR